jgi:PTS system mannose-specific IID component
MSGVTAALVRLMVIQGSWTYERLQGVGFGFASLPLLSSLAADRDRYRAAVARSAEYFNAHPYLTGIAVGASAKAELDGVAGETVKRLKTALAGPLGSLGDQLFWIGVVPAVMGATLVAVSLGAGLAAVAVALGLYLVVRIATTAWGLHLGFRAGLRVSTDLRKSGLAEAVRRIGLAAGFAVGAAVPLAVDWIAGPGHRGSVLAAAAIGGAGGVVAALVRFRVPSSRRLTLAAMGAVLLWFWSSR